MSLYLHRFWAAAAFLACVVAANVLTAHYGLIPVGLGLVATAGTWAAGLTFAARDWLHEVAGRVAVLAAIVAGAGLSAVLAGPQLAMASGVAFAISEAADMVVYEPLRRRTWAGAVFASNTVGAVVDTVVFLGLAGFPIWTAMPGQMLAKTTAWVAVVVPLVVCRAVLRNRVRPEGA